MFFKTNFDVFFNFEKKTGGAITNYTDFEAVVEDIILFFDDVCTIRLIIGISLKTEMLKDRNT